MAVTINTGKAVTASGMSKNITAVKAKVGDATNSSKLFLNIGSDDLQSNITVYFTLALSDNTAMLSGSITLTSTDYTRDSDTLFTKVATALSLTITT